MNLIQRRTFLKQSLKVGAGFSCLTLFPGNLLNPDLVLALDAKEEEKKEKLAKYTFNFGSPYGVDDFVTTPHAHLEMKLAIEKNTKNKIYVKIHDKGRMGVGIPLAHSVQSGLQIQGALLSVANLSPMVNALDILNIPFWSASDKEYIRLFKSAAWNKYVLSQTEKYKLKVLLSYVIGARTAATTKKYNKIIKAPEDFEGVKFRIPGSKNSGIFIN